MPNPNEKVTRADLEKQLEVHAKTIELQILLSQQNEQILEKMGEHEKICKENKAILEMLERRTWKQNWLFIGLMILMFTTCVGIVIELLT